MHAAKHIKAGSILLFIPKERLITIEMAMSTQIGRKMLKAGLRNTLFSPKHSFLTTFILTEIKKNKDSAWFPYIDILPKNVENFPVFYTEEEKQYLIGSPFLSKFYKYNERAN